MLDLLSTGDILLVVVKFEGLMFCNVGGIYFG